MLCADAVTASSSAFKITRSTVSGIAEFTFRGMGSGAVMCLITTGMGVSASYGTCLVSIS
jgi:hypothetical protein